MEAGLSQEEIYRTVFSEYPDLLEADQLCDMLKVCKATVYRLLREGKIKHLRVGTEYKIPKIFVLDYLGMLQEGIQT
ncbi:MAG: helix-turn-helix domain-containing protein [Lachnospiraceae bacterium]|nr:helix-turn-helix domain-containing protein [Lachnospiraceae bacterium]